MKFLPELLQMVRGMARAANSVGFIVLFLFVTVYVFAIIFVGTWSDREEYPLMRPEHAAGDAAWKPKDLEDGEEVLEICTWEDEFDGCANLGRDLCGTMGDCMMSLITRGVLGDNLAETADAILAENWIMFWVFVLFLVITFMTLLNMLIGVICEVISEAAGDEESNKSKTVLRKVIEEAFDTIDLNGDHFVSKSEWHKVKEREDVRKAFEDLGLEEERMDERLEQMEMLIFKEEHAKEDDEGLTVEELVQKVVDVRPDADASALDLCLLQSVVTKDQDFFKKKLIRMKAMLNKFTAEQNEKAQSEKDKRNSTRQGAPPPLSLAN